MISTCSSCGARIRWAKTSAGKRMPLDAEPSGSGNVLLGWIGGEEVAIVLGNDRADERAAAQIDGRAYLSHFATCPNASAHRR